MRAVPLSSHCSWLGGYLRLVEQDRLVGIDPAGDQRGCHLARIGSEFSRHMRLRDGVEVGKEEQAFALILHLHPIPDRAQIIAEVQVAGGLDAGYDTHGGFLNLLLACG
jgi:hypothetical protein